MNQNMFTRFFFLLILFPIVSFSQTKDIGIGQWRVHLSYNSAKSVTFGDNRIYCASTSNFFSVNGERDFSVLSKTEGFSDIGVSELKYSDELDLLLITYTSGNIDILENGTIINISDIFRKSIIGSKKINHIAFKGKFAYLSCDFGLVVLDCIKHEVKETFNNLSPQGVVTKVFSSTIFRDSLFIASDRGVMAAAMNLKLNLQDFNNWHTFESPVSALPRSISNFNNKVIASFGDKGVLFLNDGLWIPIVFPNNVNFSFVTSSANKFLVGGNNYVYSIDQDFQSTIVFSQGTDVANATYDKEGAIWIADLNDGLLTNKYSKSILFKPHFPNGPSTPFVWQLGYYNNKIIGVPGGYKITGQKNDRRAMFYVLENNEWINNDITFKFATTTVDLLNTFYNPFNKNLYLASFDSGLIEIKPDSTYTKFDNSNSTLTPAYVNHPFVADMELDSKNRLWVINTTQIVSSQLPTLHVLNPDGKWGKPVAFNTDMSLYLIQLVIDDNDYKWIRPMPEKFGGMIVYDSEKERTKILSATVGDGGLPSNKVQCMVKDKKGQIWIGTDKGVGVFYQPLTIFNATKFDAVKPIVDGFGLLFDQSITSIKVDGGNRKWIATTNGVWLFNEDGTKPLLNFTSANSNLLSNSVKDIQINELTGEVFFATDKGIISYRGTATEATSVFADVKAFPNPVPPSFQGIVGITGLAENVIVKITDVFGNLVYDTKSQGGMVNWDAKTYKGKKAKSGLYLVFCMGEDGEESLVTKIAIVE